MISGDWKTVHQRLITLPKWRVKPKPENAKLKTTPNGNPLSNPLSLNENFSELKKFQTQNQLIFRKFKILESHNLEQKTNLESKF